jgi:CBS-domain-containing membrane protein
VPRRLTPAQDFTSRRPHRIGALASGLAVAEHAVGVLPVVDRNRPQTLRGIVTQFDLLAARTAAVVLLRSAG